MSQEGIHPWLVQRVATALNIKPDEVDVKVPFDRYGLVSADLVAIMADLEDLLGCEFEDPTLMYEYPTIKDLVTYLATHYAV